VLSGELLWSSDISIWNLYFTLKSLKIPKWLGTARKSWFRWRAWRTRRSGEIFYLDNLLTKSYCLSKTVEWNNTICRKHNSWLVTGFVNRLTRQVPDWLIDWLMLNTSFCSISAISWRIQILQTHKLTEGKAEDVKTW
jgi:hypothetical protein